MWFVLRDLQEKIFKLIDECLNIDLDSELTIEQRYVKFLNEDSKMSAFIPKMPTTQLIVMPHDNSQIDNLNNLIASADFTENKVKDIQVSFVEIATPETTLEYMYYFVNYFLTNKILFRKCKNCNRYFIPLNNLGIEYCNRPAENSTKTCREIGPVRVYQEKAFDNPVSKLYNRAYKKRFARIKYKLITKDDFSVWAEYAREMRDKCFRGEITLEEFENWLDE